MILSAMYHLAIVKEVVKLPAIDLVKGDKQSQLWVGLKEVADVEGSQEVEARVAAILISHHSEGLSRTSLAISEAGSLSTLESTFY